MKLIINIIKIILLIYAFYFISKIEYSTLKGLFNKTQLYSIFILIIFHSFRSIRFFLISVEFEKNSKYRDSFIIYYISLALTVITPGGIGQLSRIKLLSDKGFTNLNIYNVLMIEKITDVLAILSILFFFIISSIYNINLYLILTLSALLFSVIIFFGYSIVKVISAFISKKTIETKQSSLKFINTLITSLLSMPKGNLIITYLYTTALWFLFIYVLWIGLNSVVNINLLESSGVFVINSIAVAIPITFSGYGLREIILEYTMYDNNSYNTIAVITLQYTIIYLISFLIGSLILIWTKYKLWMKK